MGWSQTVLARVARGLLWTTCTGVVATGSVTASAEGLNSETLRPSFYSGSSLLWETPQMLKARNLSLGFTLSHSLRPVVIEWEGQDVAVNEQLATSHFSLAFAPVEWFSLGVNVPFVLVSTPENQFARDVGPRVRLIDERDTDGPFLGDAHLGVRARPSFLQFYPFSLALNASLVLPSGKKQAMVSDDAMRIVFEVPMGLFVGEKKNWEIFLTPGVSAWDIEDRVLATRPQRQFAEAVLEKSVSLLLAGGARHWLKGEPESTTSGTLVVEGGLRGDFSGFEVAFDDQGSPIEVAAGMTWFAANDLSIHGSVGPGLGQGAGSPLFRVMAGVRWAFASVGRPALREEWVEAMPTSNQFSDEELDKLFEEARAESAAPSLEKDVSMLRLRVNNEIIEIGAVNFEFGKAALTASAKNTVKELYRRLDALKPDAVKIDGHTDSVGSYEYNLVLSKRRAESVKGELVKLGMSAGLIKTEGFSYKYPITSNGTSAGRAANRRIEVLVGDDALAEPLYSSDDLRQFKEWIAPGGQKPGRK